MKKILRKTLTALGVTAFLAGTIYSTSSASIRWDSYANWLGSGAQARGTAYTAKTNEPYFYRIDVTARFNDGSSDHQYKNNASITDSVYANVTSYGPVNSGSSSHEWTASGDDSSYTSKNMPIR
ncbi:hypothetical protein [Clostridium intestinale]|jgi:hypothetical protein|uniref:Uncharacterized protein n=1 Tax=Clostridium intestinale URNW TaxID=1294142 RepID=U2PYX4_9CLOT|nr:hypothetical protein [Clostridium intestinale]ERK28984.1 hypothetical protein CINTURNW_3756 [Clostridium intestinale URNW]